MGGWGDTPPRCVRQLCEADPGLVGDNASRALSRPTGNRCSLKGPRTSPLRLVAAVGGGRGAAKGKWDDSSTSTT